MFYKKVIAYCNDNSISIAAFERKCELPNGAVSKWENGGYPSVPTLKKIANATEISVEDWIKE